MKCIQTDYNTNRFTIEVDKKELDIMQYALSSYIDIYECADQPPIETFKKMHNMISDLQGESPVYLEVKET